MKTLTFLGLLQFAAIVFLLVKTAGIDEKINRAASAGQDTAVRSGPVAATATAGSRQSPDEYRLREIIREELAAALASLPAGVQAEPPAVAHSPADEESYRQQREYVAQQLDYHVSVGEITEADMHVLQGEIAKLDQAGRREMMNKLVRAMNAGEINGRL